MRTTLLIGFLAIFSSMTAQEYLRPIAYDAHKTRDTEERQTRQAMKRSSASAVELPFIDDFSQDHFLGNLDGNEVLWEGLQVSRSLSFGVNSPSVGVALFDGLDEHGQPYAGYGGTATGHRDELRSMEMNLEGSQNVVLSFFYQAEGQGNSPNSSDSLVLQFMDPLSGNWFTQWHVTGSTQTPFTPVFVSVPEAFLLDGFRFRFRSFGSLSGAIDHWALDWVYLDENRSANDPEIVDVGVYNQIRSLLNGDRTSMPWRHYRNAPSVNTLPMQSMTLRNLRELQATVTTNGWRVFHDGSEIANYTSAASPAILPMSNIDIDLEVNSAPNDFTFPTSNENFPQEFDVEFFYNTSPDVNPDNNRFRFTQHFDNYYAYDDGQADYAYGIHSFNGSGKVAFRQDIDMADTIRAVDMFFLYQGGTGLEDQLFYLTVWEDAGSGQGEVLYQDTEPRLVQFDEAGGFVRYHLQDTVLVEENSYYFGWQQPDNISLNIGNDMSADLNNGRLYYNFNGIWNASSFPGTIMIRPVVPPVPDLPVGLDEFSAGDILITPNPSNGKFYIQGQYPIGTTAAVYDIEGRRIHSEALFGFEQALDLGFTADGLYFLELMGPEGSRIIKRFVISR